MSCSFEEVFLSGADGKSVVHMIIPLTRYSEFLEVCQPSVTAAEGRRPAASEPPNSASGPGRQPDWIGVGQLHLHLAARLVAKVD